MLAETRRRRLLELITQQGYATLDELVRGLAVSESTIRRDLEALDLAGSIKRTHGGAICTGEVRSMPAFDERTGTAAAGKRAIGLAAAALSKMATRFSWMAAPPRSRSPGHWSGAEFRW